MTCIYSIGDVETDECLYVGSTNDFNQRRFQHKSKVKRYGEDLSEVRPIHKYIDSIGGWTAVDMIIEEEIDDITLPELRQIENWYIEKLQPKCNILRAHVTEEERKEDRRRTQKERNARYMAKNPEEKRLAKNRRVQEWRERNREEINAKRREQRMRNREEYNAKQRESRANNREYHNNRYRE